MVDKNEDPLTVRTPRSMQAPAGRAATAMPDAIGGTISANDRRADGSRCPIGTTILEAAKELGIRIPTLCHHPDLCIAGVCRVCTVEVEGQRTLQAACTYPITAPIKVSTSTRTVRQARRHVIDLLLARHYGECYSCARSNNCELQSLAKEYGVEFFRFGQKERREHEIEDSSYSVVRDMDKCVLCRRCVRTCIDLQEVGVLEAMGRGDQTMIGTFMDKPLADVVCINCGQCINRCPTGALREKDHIEEIWEAIDDPAKHVVIQTAPSPRAGIGESYGLPPGRALTFEMNTALRRAGFDKVFDTNFTADLTIIEEGTELILRLYNALVKKDPQVAPAAVHELLARVGQVHRALLPGVPAQRLLGQEPAADVRRADQDLLRREERDRPEGHRQRLAHALHGQEVRVQPAGDGGQRVQGRRLRRDHPRAGEDAPAGGDRPAERARSRSSTTRSARATGSGVIFGATGGVMEAALRSVVEFITGLKVEDLYEHADIVPVRGFDGIKYLEVKIPDKVGPVPDDHQAPGAGLELGQGRDAEVRRGPRDGQREEDHGGHQGRREVLRVPLHRDHGLPGRLHRRRRAADPDEPGDPGGAGRGDLLRGRGLRGAQVAREPGGGSRSTGSSSPTGRAGTRAITCCTRTTRRGGSTSPKFGRPACGRRLSRAREMGPSWGCAGGLGGSGGGAARSTQGPDDGPRREISGACLAPGMAPRGPHLERPRA